jgi:hypothetical protein
MQQISAQSYTLPPYCSGSSVARTKQTRLSDQALAITDEEMHAALGINIPNYASAIVTTNEVVDLISSLGRVSPIST